MKKHLKFTIISFVAVFLLLSCNDKYKSPSKPTSLKVSKDIYYYQIPMLQMHMQQYYENNSGKLSFSFLNISRQVIDSAIVQIDIFKSTNQYAENLLYSFKIKVPKLLTDATTDETIFTIANYNSIIDSNIVCNLINIEPYANHAFANTYRGIFEFKKEDNAVYSSNFVSGNINTDGSYSFYINDDKYKTLKGIINDSLYSYGFLTDNANNKIPFQVTDSTFINQVGQSTLSINILLPDAGIDAPKFLNVNLRK